MLLIILSKMFGKLSGLILGCFLIFVTPLMLQAQTNSELLVGTHTARIVVPKAIVYSDENMNSPLGYISNDKLVIVGNPRAKNPDLVPLVVYGRIAFIESKNIHFENESIEMLNAKRGAPREHNIDIILEKPEEKLSENNSAYFSLHQFSSGEETKTLNSIINGTDKDHFIGYGLSLLHRQLSGRAFWGAGYEYNTFNSNQLSFNIFMLRPMVGYTPLRNSLFLLDLGLSLDFSVSAKLQVKSNTDTEPDAFVYGPNITSRLVFFPDNNYHLYGEMGYRSYKVLRVENVYDANENKINGITKISGLELGIGFAIEI
jgi:hypothetical protein